THAIRFSAMEPALRRPAPRLGEHTDAVLHDLLEMSAGEIARLRAAGALEGRGSTGAEPGPPNRSSPPSGNAPRPPRLQPSPRPLNVEVTLWRTQRPGRK